MDRVRVLRLVNPGANLSYHHRRISTFVSTVSTRGLHARRARNFPLGRSFRNRKHHSKVVTHVQSKQRRGTLTVGAYHAHYFREGSHTHDYRIRRLSRQETRQTLVIAI